MFKGRLFRVLVLSVLFLGSSVGLAESELEFEFTADYFDKYVWRGQNLTDEPAFQPGLSASYGGLTVSVWGSMDTTNINGNSGDFSEIDYSLDYSGDLFEGVGYSVGAVYYDFPGTATPDTTEVYWGLSFDLPLSPSVTVYHDVDEAEGTYIALGLGHSIEKIGEIADGVPVGLELGASLGWGDSDYNLFYWGVDNSKMNDLTLSLSLSMEIVGWSVAPSLNYVTLLSDSIRATDSYDKSSDYFYAGISIAKSF